MSISINNIKQELHNLVGDEYEIISTEDIPTKNSFFMIKHNTCGNEFKTNYYRFFGSKKYHLSCRCPYCSHGHRLKTQEEFEKDVYNIAGDEYKVVSEYRGNKEKINLLHVPCGHIMTTTPNGFLSNGYRCMYCRNRSLGENRIKDYLEKNKIIFKEQYRINDCKDKRPLPFDFYIERADASWFLVEYQGTQHYLKTGSVPFATDSIKKHDIIKKEYCENNNIDLLIISYKDYDNLENIISNKLKFNDYPNGDNESQQE